jgi:TetR/AcrR family transcriptional regulator
MVETASGARRPKGQKDSELTRALLVQAGSRLFALRGIDGATVDEIAREAGVNKAMISYHFGGKEQLYGAILQEALDAARERLQAIKSSDATPPEKLARYVATFAELQSDRPNLASMLLRELLSGGRFIGKDNLAPFLSIFESVRAILAEGIARGEFRPVSPLLTHLSIVGAIVFFFATEPFRQRLITEGRLPIEPPTADDFVRHMQDLALRSLAPVEGDAP